MTPNTKSPTLEKNLAALRDRAAAEGLLDVAYATADSPFGTLLLAKTPRGLVRLGLPEEDADALLADLAGRIS
ncbi:MAG: cysteine methyltransferase, partial [Actinobacteria bacterium]|nr:cysteine methyltransferase [Actinomycetota bacterium]